MKIILSQPVTIGGVTRYPMEDGEPTILEVDDAMHARLVALGCGMTYAEPIVAPPAIPPYRALFLRDKPTENDAPSS